MVYVESYKGQTWLLPPSIEELISEDHICFLVESLIESMDFSLFDEKYSGAGRPAYHPKIILKLLVMGVINLTSPLRDFSLSEAVAQFDI